MIYDSDAYKEVCRLIDAIEAARYRVDKSSLRWAYRQGSRRTLHLAAKRLAREANRLLCITEAIVEGSTNDRP